jgi:CubicO group peptidase (beta-lactamase class C family)
MRRTTLVSSGLPAAPAGAARRGWKAALEAGGAPLRRAARLLAFAALASAGAAAAEEAGGPWPTRGWDTATPESVGIDATALAAFDAELASGAHGYVDGMLVVRHGRLVFERSYLHDYDALFVGRGEPGQYNYYDPDWHPWYRKGLLHSLQSVSKSVTSTLIGIAVGRGELPGVDVAVTAYTQGYRIADDPRWQALRLRDVLTMTAGIQWDESTVPYTDPRNSCAAMEASHDWVQFVLDQPMAAEPGEVFVYNSGATVLLDQVLHAATGRHAAAYAAERLFRPLGIRAWYWKETPAGHTDTEGGLYLSPRDLAKIGHLFARDGLWEGERLLPEGWVEASTAPRVEVSTQPGREWSYGYQWWAMPWGERRRWAVTANGYGGQYLLVVPELDLVAVFTGWNIYDRPPLSPHLFQTRFEVVGAG